MEEAGQQKPTTKEGDAKTTTASRRKPKAEAKPTKEGEEKQAVQQA
jgi:hypothetical protein